MPWSECVECYLQSPNTPSGRGAKLKHKDNFTFFSPCTSSHGSEPSVCLSSLPPTVSPRFTNLFYHRFSWFSYNISNVQSWKIFTIASVHCVYCTYTYECFTLLSRIITIWSVTWKAIVSKTETLHCHQSYLNLHSHHTVFLLIPLCLGVKRRKANELPLSVACYYIN
jgi:hypothetical protein